MVTVSVFVSSLGDVSFRFGSWIFFLVDTAFVASGPGWLYCDDSRITSTDTKEVVVRTRFFPILDTPLTVSQGRPAYVLYYKRIKT